VQEAGLAGVVAQTVAVVGMGDRDQRLGTLGETPAAQLGDAVEMPVTLWPVTRASVSFISPLLSRVRAVTPIVAERSPPKYAHPGEAAASRWGRTPHAFRSRPQLRWEPVTAGWRAPRKKMPG
jgi:hypothetical protein